MVFSMHGLLVEGAKEASNSADLVAGGGAGGGGAGSDLASSRSSRDSVVEVSELTLLAGKSWQQGFEAARKSLE